MSRESIAFIKNESVFLGLIGMEEYSDEIKQWQGKISGTKFSLEEIKSFSMKVSEEDLQPLDKIVVVDFEDYIVQYRFLFNKSLCDLKGLLNIAFSHKVFPNINDEYTINLLIEKLKISVLTYKEKKKLILEDYRESPYDKFNHYFEDHSDYLKKEYYLNNLELICLSEIENLNKS